MSIKDLFKKEVPMTFCDCLRHEVSEALKIHIEYDKALTAWSNWYNKRSEPVLCKYYCRSKISGDILMKEAVNLLNIYNYHMEQIKKMIAYGDIVRVDVNGLTYDVGYEAGVLGNYISVREVNDGKTK